MVDQEIAQSLAELAAEFGESARYWKKQRDKYPRPTLRSGISPEYRYASENYLLARARIQGVDAAAEALEVTKEYMQELRKLGVEENG